MKSDRESPRNPEAYKSRRGGVVRSAVFMGLFLMASITLAWMLALPTVIGIKIEKDTGNLWEAESLVCNPFGFEFLVEGAILKGGKSVHERRPILAIRRLKVTGPANLLISEGVRLDSVELDLERITLIRDASGVLNLESVLESLLGSSKAFGRGMPIADCHLKIHTVEILDYAVPARPSHKALRLGIDADDFAAEDAMGLFDPLFEVISRAEYLPDLVAETAFIVDEHGSSSRRKGRMNASIR